jgi:hypothetical protein
MHLDERTYRDLLAGRLPPAEARALAAHLDGACEVCETFLAGRPGADLVDGQADRALAALTPVPAFGNDLEYARIRRLARAEPRGRSWSRPVLAVAAAAAVAIAGVAGIVLQRGHSRPGWDGEKGSLRAGIPARLRFVVLGGAHGPPEKGVTGEAVSRIDRLAFEIELGRPADVAVVRVGGTTAPDVFYRRRLASGRTAVALAGRPAAYPLDGLAGPQRFVLVASEAPLTPDRLAAAARALAPPSRIEADAPALDGLSLDVVEVVVR